MNVNTWKLPETGKLCCILYISICPRSLFVSNAGIQGKQSRSLLSENYMKQCDSRAGLRVFTLHTLRWRESLGSSSQKTSVWRWQGPSGDFPGRMGRRGKRKKPKKKARDRAQWKPQIGYGHDEFPNSKFYFSKSWPAYKQTAVSMVWRGEWGETQQPSCSQLSVLEPAVPGSCPLFTQWFSPHSVCLPLTCLVRLILGLNSPVSTQFTDETVKCSGFHKSYPVVGRNET